MSDSLISLVSGSYSFISFVFALSIIVFIHEFGHYIVGRWCGIKAEIFSIGFGPVLISKTDKHGTTWQIALLPFGGFVKFVRDENGIEENSAEYSKFDSETGSYEKASVLSRTLTVLAGPVANFILTFFILIFLITANGISSDELVIEKVKKYPFENQGLLSNDTILSVNNIITIDLKSFYELPNNVFLDEKVTYQIERNGIEQNVIGPHPFPAIIGSVSLRSAASESGLKKGDLILKVNEEEIFSFLQLQKFVSSTDNYPLRLKIWRSGNIFDISVTPKIVDFPNSDGTFVKRKLIGITGGLFFDLQKESPGLFDASRIAVSQILSIISGSLNGIKNILLGVISTCNLQGPIGIAYTTGEAAQQGAASFIWIIAVLSTAIGMLNLFPIPMLDGGHLVFFFVEAITGKKPPEKIIKGFTFLGLFILITLMLIAVGNDLFCP